MKISYSIRALDINLKLIEGGLFENHALNDVENIANDLLARNSKIRIIEIFENKYSGRIKFNLKSTTLVSEIRK